MADPELPGVYRDGLRVLRDPFGQLVQVDPKGADTLLREGVNGEPFTDVTEADVKQRDFEIANGGVAGQAKTYLRAAHEAVGDFVTLPARLLAGPAVRGVNALARTFGGENVSQLNPEEVNRTLALGAPAMIAGAFTPGEKEDKLAAAQRYAEETRQLKELNPRSAFAGNLGSNIATSVATGGITTAASKAATTALMRAGMGRIAAGTLGTAAALGAEGAVYGAATAETSARDAAQLDGATAEQLRHGMGFGFLLGAGVGAGGHLLGEGVSTVGRSVRNKVTAAAERFESSKLLRPEALDTAAGGERMVDYWRTRTNANADFLREVGPQNQTAAARAKRAAIANFEQGTDTATVNLTRHFNALEEGLTEARKYVDEFTPRARDVARMMRESGITPTLAKQAKQAGIGQLQSTLRNTDVIISNLEANVYGAVEPVQKMLLTQFTNFRKQAAALVDGIPAKASAAEVNGFLNTLKKDAQKFEREIGALKDNKQYHGSGLSGPLTQAWESFEKKVQEPLRQHLERMDIWGIAGEAQAVINMRYRKSINSSDRYGKELLQVDPVKEWRPQPGVKYYADSGKAKSWVSSAGTAEGTTRQEMVRQHLLDMEDLIGAIDQYHPPEGKALQAVSKAKTAFEQIEQELKAVDERVRLKGGMEQLRRAQAQAETVLGRDMPARAVSAGVGYVTAGPVGALIGATDAARNAYNAIRGAMAAGPFGAQMGWSGFLMRPAAAIDAATALESVANGVATKIENKALKLVLPAAQKVARALPEVARQVGVGAERAMGGARMVAKRAVPVLASQIVGSENDRQERYAARVSRLQAAAADPTLIADGIQQRIPGLAEIAPGVAGELVTQMKSAADFLLSRAPAGLADPTPLEPNRPVRIPRIELDRYERLWRAVEDPTTVLDDVRRGRATPDQIAALQLSPGTYEMIRQAVISSIVDATQRGQRIPIERRIQLDVLLGLGGAGLPALGSQIATRIDGVRTAKKGKKRAGVGTPHMSYKSSSKRTFALSNAMRIPQMNWRQ